MTAARRPLRERPRWWDEKNDRAMIICRISDRKQKDGVSLEAQDHHYYRCADGRYVHRRNRQPQVNVKEQDILEQLVGAADAIEITAAFAEAVARALNETHRAATEAKKKSAEVYRAEIRALEEKEDRLFDRFDGGEIDRATYDRQLSRLRADKNDRFEKLREADTEIDTAYLDTAQDVLELAKDARSLLEGRSREEKRDFLARLVCNPRLDGRTVRFDLKKPFAVIAKMRAANDWRPQGDSNGSAHLPIDGVSRPIEAGHENAAARSPDEDPHTSDPRQNSPAELLEQLRALEEQAETLRAGLRSAGVLDVVGERKRRGG